MRIRSIKPEFWRSADTADLDMFTRLLFIGLWNYVDDNGVGEDDVHLIRSDLFPRDRNVDELSAQIRGSLSELSRRGQITRFRHLKTGRDYFHVAAWHHQKINRPTESKKPLPTSDDCQLREDSGTTHGGFTEDSLPDQGIKGTRDQGIPPYPPQAETMADRLPATRTKDGAGEARNRIANLPTCSAGAYRIAKAFSDSLPVPVESGLLSGIATQIDKCLGDDIPPPAVADGIKAWAASDSFSPTQIPNFVLKAATRTRGVGKPTIKAVGYDAAVKEILAELEVS